MAKEMIKKAGVAASESLRNSLMPQLLDRLDRMEQKIEHRFAQIDQKFSQIDQKFAHVDQRFEQQRLEFKQDLADLGERLVSVISEIGQRVAKVEGKLEVCIDTIHQRNDLVDRLIERVTKVEVLQSTRRRKAG